MGTWTKLSREAQLAILAAAIASSSTLACSLCQPFIVCDPPPPTPTMMICDPPPPPPTVPPVTPATPTPTMMICDPPPPSPSTSTSSSHPALPLAQRREVRVVQMAPGALNFAVEHPAPGGDVLWTVTGGELVALPGNGVRWDPPAKPGHYMLQAVVDWGADGLAVHSLVLTVTDDGAIVVG